MGNNVHEYKCGVCGTSYNSIAERMHCESACLKKQEDEAKKVAEAKKREEQNDRKAQVDAAIKHAEQVLRDYIRDYGTYYSPIDPMDLLTHLPRWHWNF